MSQTILLIDDDALRRRSLAYTLERADRLRDFTSYES